MATLTLTQVLMSLGGLRPPAWPLLLTVVLLCVGVSLGIGWIGELLHQARRKAEAEALRDPLTRLANRGHVSLFLETAMGAAERGASLVIVLMDLDRFKRINDRHGHAAGDATLVAFAQVLKTHTRRSDLSARYGGEEFVAVLTGPGGVKGAKVYAERVREAFSRIPFQWGPVTVSVGIAGYEPGMPSADPILSTADRALYQAKAQGRDRVVVANEARADAPRLGLASAKRWRSGGVPSPAATSLDDHTGLATGLSESAVPAGDGAAPEVGSARRSPTPRGRSRGPRVLVVSADELLAEGVCRVLRRAGYRTLAATDPAAALVRAAAVPAPDLLLTDLVQPSLGGETLALRARETNPGMRVLLVTDGEGESLALQNEHVSCVWKPLTPESLLSEVRSALSNGQAGEG
jgi:diguanylate cyclase (GGDEF)-like protein